MNLILLIYVLGWFLLPLCLRILNPSYFEEWFDDWLGEVSLICVMIIWPVMVLFWFVRAYLKFLNKWG